MSKDKAPTATLIGKLVGTAVSIAIASIINTWIGLYLLNYLNWMPF